MICAGTGTQKVSRHNSRYLPGATCPEQHVIFGMSNETYDYHIEENPVKFSIFTA